MTHLNRERVLAVHHWTDTLFSFAATRDPSFRFVSGQFTMLGLAVEGRPLLRAYSMASANHEDSLEFFSIKVEDGPLTSRLQHLKRGDIVLVGRKPTGTLVHGNLLPGKRLFLLSTGTGLAPFASIAKDPDTYERFDTIVLVHGCRKIAELAYGEKLIADLRGHEYLGEEVRAKLLYYPTVTREPFRNRGRITHLLSSGRMLKDLDLPHLDIETDRLMLCGSPPMLADLRAMLVGLGYAEGSHAEPGHFVIEKAFVER